MQNVRPAAVDRTAGAFGKIDRSNLSPLHRAVYAFQHARAAQKVFSLQNEDVIVPAPASQHSRCATEIDLHMAAMLVYPSVLRGPRSGTKDLTFRRDEPTISVTCNVVVFVVLRPSLLVPAENIVAVRCDAREHPFWLGGAAAMMSVCITHPIDQTKIRAQTQKVRLGMSQTVRNTIANEGFLGLWNGLSGSLLRQATYGAARFGVYSKLKERDQRMEREGGSSSRWSLVKNGAVAGVVAGVVGAPGELVMVRLSSDGVRPPEQRFNYRNAVEGVYRIIRQEGFSHIFRGAGATCLRSVIMNASQLSCYDIIREQLLKSGKITDGVPLHMLTAMLGGTIAVTLCAPVDVFKSRIQSNRQPVRSAIEIVRTSLQREGPRVLLRGWLPAWLRMTPTTMLTFVFFEQLKKLF